MLRLHQGCPAKALKIEDGYSQVIEDRCIGCGNCVTACTPKALVYYDSTNDVRALLKSEKKW
jgi:Fe-S-cluster-containing hydrogenase component 2